VRDRERADRESSVVYEAVDDQMVVQEHEGQGRNLARRNFLSSSQALRDSIGEKSASKEI
jgi:hypothetical protein